MMNTFRILVASFMYCCSMAAIAESYGIEPTSAESIRNAETVVEGHFTGNSDTISVDYGDFQEVKTIREFVVSGVLDGEGATVGDIFQISTVGGEKEGLSTQSTFDSPLVGETVVVGVQAIRHRGHSGLSTQVIVNQEVFRSHFSRDGVNLYEWVEKVKNASDEEYNELVQSELSEKYPEKYAVLNENHEASTADDLKNSTSQNVAPIYEVLANKPERTESKTSQLEENVYGANSVVSKAASREVVDDTSPPINIMALLGMVAALLVLVYFGRRLFLTTKHPA